MSKILLTGAAGFIGFETTKQLLADGHEVIGIDNFDETLNESAARRNRIMKFDHPLFTFLERDLLNLDYENLLSDIEAIYHFAATPGLLASWTNFDKYVDNNILVSFRLSEAIRKFGGECKVILASTSSVYGDLAVGDENIPIRPISPYGITKFASEQIFETLLKDSRAELYILRFFSVFGPNQREDMAWNKIIRAVIAGTEFPLTAQPNHVRTCTYVKDVAELCSSLLTFESVSGTYNICGSEEVRILDGIHIIESTLGMKLKVKVFPERRGDQVRTFGNSEKARDKLRFNPQISFELGIKAQIDTILSENNN